MKVLTRDMKFRVKQLEYMRAYVAALTRKCNGVELNDETTWDQITPNELVWNILTAVVKGLEMDVEGLPNVEKPDPS